MNVGIAVEREGYVLLARGAQFAVVEKRNNKLYNCHCGKRDGIPLDNLSAVSSIVEESDWVDFPIAQAALNEAVSQWTYLAEHMW